VTSHEGAGPLPLDTSVAHPARVYDYLLGGKDNYAADRIAAEEIVAISPSVRPTVRANRAFLRRAVRYLVGEAGITRMPGTRPSGYPRTPPSAGNPK
jgi:S-adenosyl methyltransferase